MATDEIVSRSLGAVLLLVIGVAFGWHFIDQKWFTCPHNQTSFDLPRPFTSAGGLAWIAEAPALNASSDTPENPDRSRYVVCEGSQLLAGPAHSHHSAVAALGEGRFSHWGNTFVFSSTDKTDPNKNGRRYVAIQPGK